MACKSCQERRIRLNRERAIKSKQGKVVQAAAIGAVLSFTDKAARVFKINGEGSNEQPDDERDGAGDSSPAQDR